MAAHGGKHEDELEDDRQRTNVKVLFLNMGLFGSFATLQMTFAVLANSLALFGDSITMLVDTLSYGLNLMAEQKKSTGRKYPLEDLRQLEVYIPLTSACLLLLVIGTVLVQACTSLSGERPSSDVNESMAMLFALLNLLLDFACLIVYACTGTAVGLGEISKHPGEANANMCSAFTHTSADTVRSLTVLGASVFAATHPDWSSSRIDSVAAIVVAAVVFAMAVPLLRGIHVKNQRFAERIEQRDREMVRAGLRAQDAGMHDEGQDDGEEQPFLAA